MGQVQVLTGVERRRRWSDEQKRVIVAAAFAPGAVVSEVARRADVCANQIYRWRRDLAAVANGFAEVMVVPGDARAAEVAVPALEVDLAGRARVRIPTTTPPELAAAVVAALARR